MTLRPLLSVQRLMCRRSVARAASPGRHAASCCLPRAAASAALGAMLATCIGLAVLYVLGSTPSFADSAAPAGHWPRVAWPEEITPIAIGSDLEVNGLPLQVQAFVSPAPPGEVARWFRRSLGPSDLQAGARARGNSPRDAERALAPWPAGSHLASSVTSLDARRRSSHTVVVNRHTEALNAERLQGMMAGRGYVLERATVLGQDADNEPPEGHGRVLVFKGLGGEALATIHRDARGRSVVVLNAVIRPERLQ